MTLHNVYVKVKLYQINVNSKLMNAKQKKFVFMIMKFKCAN